MEKANLRLSWDDRHIDPAKLMEIHRVADLALPESFGRDATAKWLGPGAFGVFATSDDTLAGVARVFSDVLTTTWLADLCVDPRWRDQGLDRLLLDHISDRFRETALYCAAAADSVDVFTAAGIRPKAKLTPCRRPPGMPAPKPHDIPGITIHDVPARFTVAGFDDVSESVGFGLSDRGMPRDTLYRQLFGEGVFGFFAETLEGRPVAFIRVLSDDLTKCYVAEICVHPEWQHRGVGRALAGRVVARFAHTAIWTEAFPNAVPMFEAAGLARDTDFVGCSRAPLE